MLQCSGEDGEGNGAFYSFFPMIFHGEKDIKALFASLSSPRDFLRFRGPRGGSGGRSHPYPNGGT